MEYHLIQPHNWIFLPILPIYEISSSTLQFQVILLLNSYRSNLMHSNSFLVCLYHYPLRMGIKLKPNLSMGFLLIQIHQLHYKLIPNRIYLDVLLMLIWNDPMQEEEHLSTSQDDHQKLIRIFSMLLLSNGLVSNHQQFPIIQSMEFHIHISFHIWSNSCRYPSELSMRKFDQ